MVQVKVDSAQGVGFFNIGSGWVLDKIPGSRSGSGRVGVLKYSIGYFRVSYLLSGISGYFWVFPAISRYFRVFPCTFSIFHVRVYPIFRVYPEYRVIPDISGYPLPDDFQN